MNIPRHLRERLTIDSASLAVFRGGLGAIVVADLFLRWPLSAWLLSPSGILKVHPTELWGLLSLGDFDGAHVGLFALAGCSALLVLLEWFPRVSAALLLLSVSSIHARNPWVLDGGDGCLRWLLLWNFLLSLELPGAKWAPVRVAPASPLPRNERIFAFSGVGLLLQPVVIYLSSVAHKLKGEAWRDGTAVEIAFSQSLWERPLGAIIAETEHLPVILTYLTLLIETLGPVLLLSPYRPRLSRWVGLGLLTALQLGIGLSLRMNLFPWIMTLALVPFVPAPSWVQGFGQKVGSSTRPLRFAVVLSQALLFQSLISAADSVSGGRLLPRAIARVEVALGIEQAWSMYSPNPYQFEFGLEVTARTFSGKDRLLDAGRREHPFPPLKTLWADYRGGIYLENIAGPGWPDELAGLAEWIARQHEKQDGDRLVEVSFALFEWPRSAPGSATKTPLSVWRALPATK